jgi:photosystem II stability/assembly factor-like uncharacterized protein
MIVEVDALVGALSQLPGAELAALRGRFLGDGGTGSPALRAAAVATVAAAVGLAPPDPVRTDREIDGAVAWRNGWLPPGAPEPEVSVLVATLAALPASAWPVPAPSEPDPPSLPSGSAEVTGDPGEPVGGGRTGRVGGGQHLLRSQPALATLAVAVLVVVALAGTLAAVGVGPPGIGPWRVVPHRGTPADPGVVLPAALDCPSVSVCYAALAVASGPAQVYRSSDGGRTWRATAVLPAGSSTALDCRSVESCLVGLTVPASGSGSPTLAVARTDDGGRRWSAAGLRLPAGVDAAGVDQLACWSRSDCVVHALGDRLQAPLGLFYFTRDGGRTWRRSGPGGTGAPGVLGALSCQAGGRCVGVGLDGETLVALRSEDGGLTWASSRAPISPTVTEDALPAGCADAEHCLAVLGGVEGSRIAVTSDAGRHWTLRAVPPGWPAVSFAVACAAPATCTVSTGAQTAGGFGSPVMESTTDGGRRWRAAAVGRVGRVAMMVVLPVSCPRGAGGGCRALGLSAQLALVGLTDIGR